MKKMTCDICKIEFKGNQKSIELRGTLIGNIGQPFRFKIETVSFEFDCSNFDVCDACIMNAIKYRINEL